MQNIWFIKIHRKIRDNPIFWKPNYLAVFMCIILDVEFQETTRVLRGDIINLRPWEWLFFQKEIADKFNISIGTVSNILKKMNSENIIEIRTTSKYSIIGLVNWEAYQVQIENTSENELKTSWNRTENELKHLKNTKEDSKKTQRKKIIEWEEKYIKEKNILEFWNSFWKNIQHQESEKIFESIKKAFWKFSEDQMIKWIKVYWEVLIRPDAFFSYRWTLEEFLKREWGLNTFMHKTVKDYIKQAAWEKKPFVDYEAQKREILAREAKANKEKQDFDNQKAFERQQDDKIMRWFESLPEESELKKKIEKAIDENSTIKLWFDSLLKLQPWTLMYEQKLEMANKQRERLKIVVIRQFYS